MRSLPFTRCLLLVLACGPWAVVSRAEEGEAAPGPPVPAAKEDDGYRALGDSDVAIRVPEGFVPATSFVGFQNVTHGASFVLKTWELPLDAALERCTAEAFEAQQRKLLGREEVEVGARHGALFELALSRGGYDYREWYLILGDGPRTVGLTGIFAVSRAALMSDLMRKTVLGVRIGAAAEADPFADLPFRLEPVAPFGLCRIENGNALFTIGGKLPVGGPGETRFVVGPSSGQVKAGERRSWALARLKAIRELRDIRVRARTDIEVDGLPGIEITADATHVEGNVSLVVYQIVLFDTERYYIAQGFAEREGQEEIVEAFRAMARGFARKPVGTESAGEEGAEDAE